jgi:hypothetical protein
MPQSHVLPPSVAQSAHGQHSAAHDTLNAPPAAQVSGQSQHWQASVLPNVGVQSTLQPFTVASKGTVPMCGQLKIVHLAQTDHHFLEQLQPVADKPPFANDLSLRNEWCIAPELSKGCFLQSWCGLSELEGKARILDKIVKTVESRRLERVATAICIQQAES